MHKML